MKYIKISKNIIHARDDDDNYIAEIRGRGQGPIEVSFASWTKPICQRFQTMHDAKAAIVARIVAEKMENS